jgi:hypothetical protein
MKKLGEPSGVGIGAYLLVQFVFGKNLFCAVRREIMDFSFADTLLLIPLISNQQF